MTKEITLTEEFQACQFKSWNENGHKSECKILKIAGEIFGSESEQAAIV
jgi:hypothetical protein